MFDVPSQQRKLTANSSFFYVIVNKHGFDFCGLWDSNVLNFTSLERERCFATKMHLQLMVF